MYSAYYKGALRFLLRKAFDTQYTFSAQNQSDTVFEEGEGGGVIFRASQLDTISLHFHAPNFPNYCRTLASFTTL